MSEVRIASAKGRMLVSSPRLKTGLDDIVHGLTRWGSWWVLAVNDLQQRYGRSRIGQFWLTISMAVTVRAWCSPPYSFSLTRTICHSSVPA